MNVRMSGTALSNMILQQKSAQLGNNLAEQKVNNDNKAKNEQTQ